MLFDMKPGIIISRLKFFKHIATLALVMSILFDPALAAPHQDLLLHQEGLSGITTQAIVFPLSNFISNSFNFDDIVVSLT